MQLLQGLEGDTVTSDFDPELIYDCVLGCMQGLQACCREDADDAHELITHHEGFNCNLLVTQDPAVAEQKLA